MSDLRKAAQQALEALENSDSAFYAKKNVAMITLRAALAKPDEVAQLKADLKTALQAYRDVVSKL